MEGLVKEREMGGREGGREREEGRRGSSGRDKKMHGKDREEKQMQFCCRISYSGSVLDYTCP